MRTKIFILGLICFFVFISGCKDLPTSPDLSDFKIPETTIPSATVIMEGTPKWWNEINSTGYDGPIFGVAGYETHGGRLKNVGTKIAKSVMLKVTLYDPNGNYLTEKYAEFFSYPPFSVIGQCTDILIDEYASWRCYWDKEENIELFEQLDSMANHYRPDRDPEKCFVITWKIDNLLKGG